MSTFIIYATCGVSQTPNVYKRLGGIFMTIDTNAMVSITEANQNFSKVARLVDELGAVVILKNNEPRYLLIDFSKADDSAVASDEDVLEISSCSSRW